MKVPPPKSTGRVTNDINLRGTLFMWADGQPVVIRVPGVEVWCLPVYTSKEKLVASARELALRYESIKQITDHDEFFESIEGVRVEVVLDPSKTKEGTLRYMRLVSN